MRAGFTGTREGTTAGQRSALLGWVQRVENDRTGGGCLDELHHGCCVGADVDAVQLLARGPIPRALKVVGHPPENMALVSEFTLLHNDENRNAESYLNRNRSIVDSTDVLLACPKGPEERRSGTWSTIRYARKVGKPIIIFWPDGSVTKE